MGMSLKYMAGLLWDSMMVYVMGMSLKKEKYHFKGSQSLDFNLLGASNG